MRGLTLVRHDATAARELLDAYVFGGSFGLGRVPRGVAPAVASQYLVDHVRPDCSAVVYQKALEVGRFYELSDVVPYLMTAFDHPLTATVDLRRAAFVIQACGDLGTQAQAAGAAAFLDAVLVPHDGVTPCLDLLLESRLALAPAGSDRLLQERIQHDVEVARGGEQRDERSMMEFDRLLAVQDNALPRMQAVAAEKVRMSALPPPEQCGALVATYLGQSAPTGPYLVVWAGRQVRRLALGSEKGRQMAEDALRRALAAAPRDARDPRLGNFVAYRAGQAMSYLGGQLTAAEQERVAQAAATGAAMNFLWDDL